MPTKALPKLDSDMEYVLCVISFHQAFDNVVKHHIEV